MPRSGDGTLLRIDLQFEAPFDEAGQACHDPSASLFTADVNVTVIRVPHELVAATLKLAIQLIQHEVREQGRERTALRCPLPAFLEQPMLGPTTGNVRSRRGMAAFLRAGLTVRIRLLPVLSQEQTGPLPHA